MGTWSMSWGDEAEAEPPVHHSTWPPRPVPVGTTRVVRVVLRGFHGLTEDPLLVAWDDTREAVRRRTGELGWQRDGGCQAFPRDGDIVVQDLRTHPYPRGNRFMDARVVRSFEDVMETENADEVTGVDPDGTIYFLGAHDNSRGRALRDEETGIVLRASGRQGNAPEWSFTVLSHDLVDGDELLAPTHLPSAAF